MPNVNKTNIDLQQDLNQLTLALELAKKGYKIHPLRANSQTLQNGETRGPGTPHLSGFPNKATTDPAELHQMWADFPDAVPGVLTGDGAGLYILDVDVKDGKDGIGELKRLGVEPEELTPGRVKTHSNGLHLYFQSDGSGLRNSQNDPATGLDWRGHNGYVRAAGAVTDKGTFHPIGEMPDLADLPPPPDALLPTGKSKQVKGEDWAGGDELAAIRSGESLHGPTLDYAIRMATSGYQTEARTAQQLSLAYLASSEKDTPRWKERFADLPRLVHWAYSESEAGKAAEWAVVAEDYLSAADVPEPDSKEDWGSPLLDVNGKLINNQSNTIRVLGQNLDAILPELRFNKLTFELEWQGGTVEDHIFTTARSGIEHNGLPRATKLNVIDAIEAVAHRFAYHPVQDYLDGLIWDGKPRLDSWLVRTVHTDDTPYYRDVSRRIPLMLVARMKQPGCKVDHMPVFHGEENQGKSTVCRILAGDWFSDTPPSIHKKEEALRHLVGHWGVELAELAPTRQTDKEELKAFVSGSVDKVRFPFARTYRKVGRTCVLFGTTNNSNFLNDQDGGRRYWPIEVRVRIDVDQLRVERDQLFAEAVVAFEAGEKWWPDHDFEQQHYQPMQAAAREIDPWEDRVRNWWKNDPYSRGEWTLWELARDSLDIPPAALDKRKQMRLSGVLRKIGFSKTHTGKGNVWKWDGWGLI